MFKSPIYKLMEFFPKSRDRWKAKCKEAKLENKKLANQVRAVEKSRKHWRQVAKDAQRHAAKCQSELAALKRHATADC